MENAAKQDTVSNSEFIELLGMKCFSTNNEDFSYDELDDAVRDALYDPEIKVGDVVTVYEGDAVRFKAGDFSGWNLDQILNTACDEGGE